MTLCIPISLRGLDEGHICPVLRHLATYHPTIASDDARAMLLRVAAAESELQWLQQHRGPARSYWQMEPRTACDTVERMPRALFELMGDFFDGRGDLSREAWQAHALTWNPWAACALARAYWWLDPHPLPPWQNAEAQGAAWKRYWNTELGAGTLEGFRWKCHETGVEAYISEVFEGHAQ